MGTRHQRNSKIKVTEKKAASWNARVRKIVVGIEGATINTTALAFAIRFVLNICDELQHVVTKMTLYRATTDLEFYW